MLTASIARHPRRALLGTLAFVLVAIVLGGPIFGALDDGDGFVARDAESTRAVEAAERASGVAVSPAVVALVRPDAAVGSPAGERRLREVARGLAAVPGVATVQGARGPPLSSTDGRTAYLAATLAAGADEDAVLAALEERFEDAPGVTLGGSLLADDQLGSQISEDLGRAETIAFPLLLLLSFLFFRGWRAAALPLIVGVVTIFGTFLVLRGINEIKELSIFSLNLVIGLGLGLAIDYMLFLLTRYREELERSGPGPAAVRATMATAGRTVLYSAATVAIALAGLVVFPLGFLQSMGIGGAAVALIAAAASCVIAPALFSLWNVKLRARRSRTDGAARWYSVAQRVMARPGLVAVLTMAVMVALTLPALRAEWTPVDVTSVPEGLSARTVGDTLARDFPREQTNPALVTIEAGREDRDAVGAFARQIADAPGVARVAEPRSLDASTWQIDVTARGEPTGQVARDAVAALREQDAGFPVLVGGEAAEFIDQQDAIGSRLPLALGLLAFLTFAVLWLMTGSVVLPIKALVMNVLTVGSTLGLLTLVFQDGRFEGLLGYTANGGIEPTDFVVTAALVFALSTDYGVFLLGRIKEARDRGLPDREAVAVGLSQTGSVVTAAAILLAVAIGAFTTSSVLFIKQIGLGAALGVLIDAFVVRGLLVPALMAMLGKRNWWSPGPLRRLHRRLGVRDPHGLEAA
ncbi:MAG: MMPL family transporter [Solirubrobacterales bacterium]|nr:MMPL family transporter [Solirubrobacterales bacterium]